MRNEKRGEREEKGRENRLKRERERGGVEERERMQEDERAGQTSMIYSRGTPLWWEPLICKRVNMSKFERGRECVCVSFSWFTGCMCVCVCKNVKNTKGTNYTKDFIVYS